MKNKRLGKLFIFLLAFASIKSVFASSVEVRLSKIHGLLTFAEAATGEPMQSSTLREYFEQSKMYSPDTLRILNRFRSAHRSVNWGMSLPNFPLMRNQVRSGESLLVVQSVYASDIDDFRNRTVGIIPMSEHLELISALKDLLPYYEKYIWNPSFEKMEEKQQRFNELAKKINADHLIQKVAKFYGVNLAAEDAFVISFYPIPGKSGHTMARPFETTASVGLLTDDNDVNSHVSTVFHEICHSIYGAQTSELQWNFEKWFVPRTSKFGNLAYFRINEALATALGSGYIYGEITGGTNLNSWYSSAYDRYIDPFSKGLYPVVKQYLAEEKTMDQNFIRRAVKIFETTFPTADSEFDNIFNRLAVFVDDDLDLAKVQSALASQFPIISFAVYSSFNDPEGIKHLEGSTDTVMLITTNRNRAKLKILAQHIPPINKWIKKGSIARESSFQYSQLVPGRTVIFISTDSTDRAVTLIREMKKIGKIKDFK